MLAKRTISAAIIALVGAALILSGGWIYTIGISCILAIAAWEFTSMFKEAKHNPHPVLVAAGTSIITLSRNFQDPTAFALYFIMIFFTICVVGIWGYSRQETNAIDLAIDLAALVFILFPGSFLIQLRSLPDGLFWAFACIFCASISDVAAYLFGSALGKAKLAPRVSPNKTIVGYVCGVLFSVITGLFVGYLARLYQVEIFPATLMIGAAVGLIAPFGDLSKSVVKRSFSLKDTGNSIPGHGGVLDRIDTILWAAPVSYLIIYFL